MTTKKIRIISIFLIIFVLPLSITTVAGGGSIMAYLFAALLAFGIDMLFERSQSDKG